MDLPHVWSTSRWIGLHFRDCQNCFCLLLTLSTFRLLIFLIPATFHPKRWSFSSPRCPGSEHFPLNSNPLDLALIGKAEVYPHQNALSSLLSTSLISEGLSN